MMNMMGGMSAPGGTGGMMQPREQPVVASTSMQTGLPLQNAYGLGGYSQNPVSAYMHASEYDVAN